MFTSEASLKIRTAIKVKLAELGNDVYEELPDYIMVMVANKKTQEQMTKDLALFLGDSTVLFTSWLHSLLSKLQSVAAVGKQASVNHEDHYNSESEHSNEDATCATPRSDEISRDFENQEEEEEIDNTSGAFSAVNDDATRRSVDRDNDISRHTNTETDNSTEFRKERHKQKLYPQTRRIKIKKRKLDSESSDRIYRCSNKGDHEASVSSSQQQNKEHEESVDRDPEWPTFSDCPEKTEDVNSTPETKSSRSSEVSSSVQQSEEKKGDSLTNNQGETFETEENLALQTKT